MFLGIPFNIASYALLTHLIANECGLVADELIHSTGDAHIYKNHIEQAKLQLTREPFKLPKNNLLDFINNYTKLPWHGENLKGKFISNYIQLNDYEYHPTIKAEVSV